MKRREKAVAVMFLAIFIGLVGFETGMALAVAHVEPFCRCCDPVDVCPECPARGF